MSAPVPAPVGVVVAVDGPSGSGKSSTARGVARVLGYRYLDTGAMYRAMTWWMLQQDVDVHDRQAVASLAARPVLTVSTDPDVPHVEVDGHDVTNAIRDPEVTRAVSAVSAVSEVRARLVQVQQAAMAGGGIVVEGRDIGTVVAPDAQVKVYLVASTSARAARRAADLAHHSVTVADTHASLERRDAMDSTREISPLTQAKDAVEIDSTAMSLDEVVEAVVSLVRSATGEDAR
ncbi:MAG: (d)CMP kinase [Actinomycetota bacterium]|nr:(d)CMP kinase [Actinomycetota bacterium]MDH4353777.1 (d)CMP kinase [Actinomycetota bacterium]